MDNAPTGTLRLLNKNIRHRLLIRKPSEIPKTTQTVAIAPNCQAEPDVKALLQKTQHVLAAGHRDAKLGPT